jgi:hypothetical protein
LGQSRVVLLGQGLVLAVVALAFLLLTVYRGIARSQTPAVGEVWAGHSAAQDLLIPPPELVAYLRYWAGRPNTENLYAGTMVAVGVSERLEALHSVIDDALCDSRSVYFAPAVIDSLSQEDFDRFALAGVTEELRLFFGAYEQQAAFSYLDNGRAILVNRIVGPTHCVGSDSSSDAKSWPVPNES